MKVVKWRVQRTEDIIHTAMVDGLFSYLFLNILSSLFSRPILFPTLNKWDATLCLQDASSQRTPMRVPYTGSSSQVASVHEHGRSEPAKTIPGVEEEPVDGGTPHNPRNET